MKTPVIAAAAGLSVLAGLGVGAWFAFGPGTDDPLAPCRSTAIAAGPIGGDFTLVSETGASVTRDEIVTGLALVYFGYTFCPDVCPADAARNADAVDALKAKGIAVTPVFVTIDPGRDTPEALAEFTGLIHPEMIGLTGSPEVLRAVQKSFLVYAAQRGEGEDYLMDHSSFSYLLAKGRGVIDVIRHEQTAEDIVKAVSCFAERLG